MRAQHARERSRRRARHREQREPGGDVSTFSRDIKTPVIDEPLEERTRWDLVSFNIVKKDDNITIAAIEPPSGVVGNFRKYKANSISDKAVSFNLTLQREHSMPNG